MSKLQTWQAVQDKLETMRTELNQEIASYPAPITGCDAQFNHLLEQRTDLNAELGRVKAALAGGADAAALTQYIESCPYLAEHAGEEQQ
jgi:chorismate mutase